MNLSDLQSYLDDHNKEARSGSERGLVILCVSYLDQLLKELLAASQPANGKVRKSFSSRIDAAHKLGLITDFEKAKLEAMRRLRNSLAHEFGISLRRRDHLAMCEDLIDGYSLGGISPQQVSAAGKVSLVANIMGANLISKARARGSR